MRTIVRRMAVEVLGGLFLGQFMDGVVAGGSEQDDFRSAGMLSVK